MTKPWGYDAERTVAEDGTKIIYTPLSGGDLDLWTMNLDGSDKIQITDQLGYDGGAFFSYDGTKIVWRAFYPETDQKITHYKQLPVENTTRRMSLQIDVMNSNGENKIKITNNDGASFAPYFFIDDNRVIFSSNMKDPKERSFDFWAVGIDGNNLEQTTPLFRT